MVSIIELTTRPIIRNDKIFEVFNKMTDEEIIEWENQTKEKLLSEGVLEVFPDWCAGFLSKLIDFDIIYRLIIQDKKNKNYVNNKSNKRKRRE